MIPPVLGHPACDRQARRATPAAAGEVLSCTYAHPNVNRRVVCSLKLLHALTLHARFSGICHPGDGSSYKYVVFRPKTKSYLVQRLHHGYVFVLVFGLAAVPSILAHVLRLVSAQQHWRLPGWRHAPLASHWQSL